jgi:hypothetical protein
MESKIEKAVGKAIRTFFLRRLHNPFELPSWAFWGTHQGEANGPPLGQGRIIDGQGDTKGSMK